MSVVLTDKIDTGEMSVFELVSLGRLPHTGFFGRLNQHDIEMVEQALSLLNIQHLKHKKVQMLSDGERQKAFIAKAMAQETPLMLLDEPSAFLDYPSKVELMQQLNRLAKEYNKIVILSTHDLDIALKADPELWFMSSEGQLITGRCNDEAMKSRWLSWDIVCNSGAVSGWFRLSTRLFSFIKHLKKNATSFLFSSIERDNQKKNVCGWGFHN